MLLKGLGPSDEKVTLSKAVDRLLADGVPTREDLIERISGAAAPPLELYETVGQLVVKAHLPGVAPEELSIGVPDTAGRVLTISGETRADGQHEAGDHRQLYGAFECTVALPCAVKQDQAVAELADGVLTVTLAKAEAAQI